MKKYIKAILLSVAASLLIISPVLAVFTANLLVTNTTTTAYDMFAANVTTNIDYMAANDYFDSPDGLDTRVNLGLSAQKHMLATDRLLFSLPLPATSSQSLSFTTGSANLTTYPIVIGHSTNINRSDIVSGDAANLEFGDNFTVSASGWFNTDNGTNKSIAYKPGAFDLFVSPTVSGNITAEVLTTVNFTKRPLASNQDIAVWWTGAAWTEDLASAINNAGYIAGGVAEMAGCGMLFTSVTIPQGSDILSANITFKAAASLALNDVNSRITGVDSDTTGVWSTAVDLFARPNTTANITWDKIPAWVINNLYTTPDIAAIIQEIVDRPGWVSGNNIGIIWEDFEDRSTNVNDTYRQGHSWDSDPAVASLLDVSYEVVTASVSATGVASGNHTTTVARDNPFWKLGIDATDADLILPSTVNLTLNLPLWQSEFNTSGANFTSIDSNAIECDPVGVTWSSEGYYFDGTDYITLPTGEGLTPETGTIMGWVKFDDLTANSNLYSSNNAELSLRRYATHFYFYYDSVMEVVWAQAAAAGEWVHVAVAYNKGGTGRGFEDGVFKGSTLINNVTPTEAAPQIGRRIPPSEYLEATLGEFRIYSRKLSDDEILHNYNATKAKYTGGDVYNYSGLGTVPNNSGNWTFMANNVMPYADNISMSVDGTQQLLFNPNTIIESYGTTGNMTDRSTDGVDNWGLITWGGNPAGVGVALGPLISDYSVASADVSATQDVVPDITSPVLTADAARLICLAAGDPIFYPLFHAFNSITNVSILSMYWMTGLVLATLLFMAIYRFVPNLLISAIAYDAVIGFFVAFPVGCGVYDFPVLAILVIFTAGMALLEGRSPV